MSRRLVQSMALLCLVASSKPVLAQQVGLVPTPTLQNVEVQAQTTFDANQSLYTYAYTITNPGTNTGEIWSIEIEISQPFREQVFSSQGHTIPFGFQTLTFDEVLAIRRDPIPMVPVGMEVPSGWNGGLGATGFAFFATGGPAIGSDMVMPGETQGGFNLISRGLPTIRNMNLIPHWVFLVDTEEDVTPELKQQAVDLQNSLPLNTKTLGPSAVSAGTAAHWNQVRDDLDAAIQLGWIPDAELANTLVAQLALAREAIDANDGTLAKDRLQPIVQAINQSTPAQQRVEVADLLLLNIDQMILATPDTSFPFQPEVTLTPQSTTLPIGTLYTLTATVVNLGDPATPPVLNFELGFQVVEGPNQGLEFTGSTNAQGQLGFSYTSTQLGTDKVIVGVPFALPAFHRPLGPPKSPYKVLVGLRSQGRAASLSPRSRTGTHKILVSTLEFDKELGFAEVTWSGGPDLIVPLFIPPLVDSEPGAEISLRETTGNIGSVAVGPSITRYFISEDPEIDPNLDLLLGERSIPALQPGEESASSGQTFTIPSDLAPGIYHLAACADAPGSVVELEEQNNCSFNIISSQQSFVIPGDFTGVPNSPPLCGQAIPSKDILWPPNHRLATIVIQGVVDPENDAVTIVVTGISQDEPVNGLGDGDISPDGFGVGTTEVQLRKERSGTENGRVYHIAFTGDDGRGGTCSGVVAVGVPLDQGQGDTPIDDGQAFDSTQP